jgi:hypothetical protein
VVALEPVAGEGVLHGDGDGVLGELDESCAAEPGLEELGLYSLADLGADRLPGRPESSGVGRVRAGRGSSRILSDGVLGGRALSGKALSGRALSGRALSGRALSGKAS